MEQFAQEFPKNESTPWVLDQLLTTYVKANDADKILATADRILALDPADVEAPMQCLKVVEAKKDLEGVKKWAAVASANARKMAATSQPKDAEEAESWKQE